MTKPEEIIGKMFEEIRELSELATLIHVEAEIAKLEKKTTKLNVHHRVWVTGYNTSLKDLRKALGLEAKR